VGRGSRGSAGRRRETRVCRERLVLGLRDHRLVRCSLLIPPAELVRGSVVGAVVYRVFSTSYDTMDWREFKDRGVEWGGAR
jgi:hypothetical protein